uniref:Putative IstB domain protein ATP-binding protein n=1 Tax=viral metagenome TaxID=1070528 RepID=A0A6M3JMT9_9ZZZZ
MAEDIIKELRVCKDPDCKKEYTAEIINCMGVRILKGMGYCPDHARKMYEIAEIKDREKTAGEIVSKRRFWREVKSGIPSKFMYEDLSTFNAYRADCMGLKKAFDRCVEYVENWPFPDKEGNPYRYWLGYPSVLFYSKDSWGIGKSHLACAVAHGILNRWMGQPMACPVKFVSEYDIFSRIQKTYNYNQEESHILPSEADIINDLTAVPLLIIDDIGKRQPKDLRFVQRIYFSIIDGRYKSQRPVVLTANLNAGELKTYLGRGNEDEATYDRIFEMIGGKVIHMEGPSYRRENKV